MESNHLEFTKRQVHLKTTHPACFFKKHHEEETLPGKFKGWKGSRVEAT